MNKNILKVVALMLAIMCIFAGCSVKKEETKSTDVPQNTQSQTASPQQTHQSTPESTEEITEKVFATITMEDDSVIKLELYPNIAPETVKNFVSLARKGFYDGVTFHRVVKGFVIQGGEPEGNGFGGPGYCIKGEFEANGFKNDLKHERGVISMARLSKPFDSAGSQFFIVHQDAMASLDGLYAGFGRVIEGMEVVDKIASVETDPNTDMPLEPVVIKSITIDGPELGEPEKLPSL